MKKLLVLLTLASVTFSCGEKEEITPAQKQMLLLKSAAIQNGDDQDDAGDSYAIPPGGPRYCKVCKKTVTSYHDTERIH